MSNNKYKLTKRELDVLNVLWSNEKSLIASHISQLGNNLSINTVQATLRTLLKKNLIVVDDIVYSGKVLTRKYRPTITQEDLEINILKNQFQKIDKSVVSIPKIIVSLIENEKNEEKIIEDLEKRIIERKQILNKKED